MRRISALPFFILSLSLSILAPAQTPWKAADGGGPFLPEIKDDLSPAQRTAIITHLKANELALIAEGKIDAQPKPAVASFQWPLRKAANFTDHGYYGISNYVDQNFSAGLVDYNCGNRTYEQHKGTDIFLWPFWWEKMAAGAVEVIAAQTGTIIGKTDGNYDQSCALCSTCPWNAVYVRHADGSVAWYGHLKTASLTPKTIGQTVAQGEYLGVVGSSGNSTGPHLHFEVYTNNSYTQLVDPYDGSCNSLNPGQSWWAAQESNRVPTLNALVTHSAPPGIGACPGAESVNRKTAFQPGDPIVVATYYRDQLNGQTATHTIYRPDNSVWQTWNQALNGTYNASYWYFSYTLPSTASTGTWRYEVNYNGTLHSTYFTVGNVSVDLSISSFSMSPSNPAAGTNILPAATVQNTGNGPAPPFQMDIILSTDAVKGNADDVLAGTAYWNTPLQAGSSTGGFSTMITLNCNLGGNYHYFFVLDPANQINESNESNNTVTATMSIQPNTGQVSILQNDTTICAGSTVNLSVTGASTYQWSPSTGLNNPFGSTVVALPQATTSYVVQGNNGGCITKDTILITVLSPAQPAVSISYSGCPSGPLQFQATPVQRGANPQFQWFVNNTPSGAGATFSLAAPAPGTQVFCRMNSNAPCAPAAAVQSNTITANCNATAITDVGDMSEVAVTPNPSAGKFSIHFGRVRIREVEVLNAGGKMVYRKNSPFVGASQQLELDLTSLPAGVYFLKIRSEKQWDTRKLVVIR